jgi:hypothetical protein
MLQMWVHGSHTYICMYVCLYVCTYNSIYCSTKSLCVLMRPCKHTLFVSCMYLSTFISRDSLQNMRERVNFS